ncbi:MAG TPA: NAD-dependent epimerase/dehydratase family protein [Bacteroidales bacterium]|nr:NAD-dependent epimerase/dehydratase family protein [Bacteroidales bacterium]
MRKILLTGMAGFVGFHLAKRLAKEGIDVTGVDNLNAYYDPELKKNRLSELGFDTASFIGLKPCNSTQYPHLQFIKADLTDKAFIDQLFATSGFDCVIHLAAQPGIRASINTPYAYLKDNLEVFLNILEACRHHPVQHLIYASSSSVYGANNKLPNTEDDKVDHPMSLYAVTKRANELMAQAYSQLYNIPASGLRFFTVYGPWGRPDMAYFRFAKAIAEGQLIEVYNNGQLERDFTYVDDIIEGMFRLINIPPQTTPPAAIYNIGKGSPVKLLHFIALLEKYLGREAIKKMLPMQQGDVFATHADCSRLESVVGFVPETPLEKGLKAFVEWFNQYQALSSTP